MQELIEQVKRIIGATGAEMAFPSERTKAALDAAIAEANFPALLAHMQAQQAVVDAAKKARQFALNAENVSSASALGEHIADIFNCLDAALEKESNAQ